MVKVISEIGSGNPMRTLLFIFCGYCFQFEARLLRYVLVYGMEKWSDFFPSFSTLKATKSLSASLIIHYI